jgi:hypothetical protein
MGRCFFTVGFYDKLNLFIAIFVAETYNMWYNCIKNDESSVEIKYL